MFDSTILKPGDHILYSPSNWVGYIIALKTWTWKGAAHIEVYIGNNQSVGARLEGVKVWPLRNDKYAAYILRPKCALDMDKAMAWFMKEANGDHYSIDGLFKFFLPNETPIDSTKNYKSEFCSMLADMFDQKGGFYPLSPQWPATKTAPAQFRQSPAFDIIWES